MTCLLHLRVIPLPNQSKRFELIFLLWVYPNNRQFFLWPLMKRNIQPFKSHLDQLNNQSRKACQNPRQVAHYELFTMRIHQFRSLLGVKTVIFRNLITWGVDYRDSFSLPHLRPRFLPIAFRGLSILNRPSQ
jgi:hypothetical protein